jgi:hypothetical protein
MDTDKVRMKNLEELQQEKLMAEINLINAKIKKEYPESKPLSRFARISLAFKNWYAIILAVIAVSGGFWGIFAPVKSYFKEQNKAVQYVLNENMIKAMEKLDLEEGINRDNAIMILSYYDLNAIPIFLDKLVSTDFEEEKNLNLQQKYIEAINLIYKRNRTDIVNKIIIKMEYHLNEISVDDPGHIYALINLSVLVENLNMVRQDRIKVKDLYESIKNKIATDPAMADIDGVPVFEEKVNKLINKL